MKINDVMKYKCVVFDLDGTLVSSHKTIYEATLRTFKELEQKVVIPEDRFYKTIGLHFKDIFDEFKIDVDDIENFIDIYKTFYFDYINSSKLYDGVETLLSFCKKNNIYTGLLTTKGQEQAEKIINYFNLTGYFDIIVGRRNGLPIKPSPEALFLIGEQLKINPEEILMVGDTEMDIQSGKNAGAGSCAVTFGYRTKSLLEKEKPDYIIGSILDVIKIIMGGKII